MRRSPAVPPRRRPSRAPWRGPSGSCSQWSTAPPYAPLTADTGAFGSLGGRGGGVAGVLVGPARIPLQVPCLNGVVGVVRVGQGELNCRSGPKCASMGFAQEALVGVKHSSTLFFRAHRRILLPLWADRCCPGSRIGAPSGGAARIDCSAAKGGAVPSWRRLTPRRPVQLGVEVRVAGFLPGLGPLERHAAAREQAAQGLAADAYRAGDMAPQMVGELADRPASEGPAELGGEGGGRLDDELLVVMAEQAGTTSRPLRVQAGQPDLVEAVDHIPDSRRPLGRDSRSPGRCSRPPRQAPSSPCGTAPCRCCPAARSAAASAPPAQSDCER